MDQTTERLSMICSTAHSKTFLWCKIKISYVLNST